MYHTDHLDHTDHMDHIDHVDHVDDLDFLDHLDHLSVVKVCCARSAQYRPNPGSTCYRTTRSYGSHQTT